MKASVAEACLDQFSIILEIIINFGVSIWLVVLRWASFLNVSDASFEF